jgi:hypothetical protein
MVNKGVSTAVISPSRLLVFVGFSDDRRLALVFRFAVFVLVLIVIIVVGVSWRHRVAMVTRLQSTVEKFSGMRRVMSAPCWMSRHSCADVTVRARASAKGCRRDKAPRRRPICAACGSSGRLQSKPSIDVAEIGKLKAEGLGPTKIAKRLKIGRASVYRVLAPVSAS